MINITHQELLLELQWKIDAARRAIDEVVELVEIIDTGEHAAKRAAGPAFSIGLSAACRVAGLNRFSAL